MRPCHNFAHSRGASSPELHVESSTTREDVMAGIVRLAITCLASASVLALASLAASPREKADDAGVRHAHYGGVPTARLAAGRGAAGRGSAPPPGVADPLHP